MDPGKRILVTGGNGYLGTHVVNYFQAVSASRRTGWNILKTDPVQLDNFEVVIHLAAHIDKRNEGAPICLAVNAEGTRRLGEQLRAGQTLIYASTKDVYNSQSELYQVVPETCSTTYENQSGYGWSKWLGEEYLRYFSRKNGFRLGIFRFSTIFASPTPGNPGGWVSAFARIIRNEQTLKLKEQGKQIRDVLPVSELCRAMDLFLKSGLDNELFNIGGGSGLSGTLLSFAEQIGFANKMKAHIEAVNEPIAGDQSRYISDISHLREKIGWVPEVNLEKAFRHHA